MAVMSAHLCQQLEKLMQAVLQGTKCHKLLVLLKLIICKDHNLTQNYLVPLITLFIMKTQQHISTGCHYFLNYRLARTQKKPTLDHCLCLYVMNVPGMWGKEAQWSRQVRSPVCLAGLCNAGSPTKAVISSNLQHKLPLSSSAMQT